MACVRYRFCRLRHIFSFEDMSQAAAFHHGVVAVHYYVGLCDDVGFAGYVVFDYLILPFLFRCGEFSDESGFPQRYGFEFVARPNPSFETHQGKPCRGSGTCGASADDAGVDVGGGAGAVMAICNLLYRAHEVQKWEWTYVTQGVVGETAFGADGYYRSRSAT